jgi:hypothetical protein
MSAETEDVGRLIAPARQVSPPETDPAGWLDEALEALPAVERDAVVLRCLSGLSEGETAAALGCRKATAARRVLRGLERLRASLDRRGRPLAPAALGVLLDRSQTLPPAGFSDKVLARCTGKAALPATLADTVRRIEARLT